MREKTQDKSTDSESQKQESMEMPRPLQRAITRGMGPGGDLTDEMRELDDYTIRSRADDRFFACAASDQ